MRETVANLKFADWLEQNHSRFESLTEVTLIVTRLLKDASIPYLTINGRTKSVSDCVGKLRRKNYKNPIHQMTDISGIRIVVYFDYDIDRVNELIEANFAVDEDNSSNRDELLLVNEVGYRSVHYVCDLGQDRVRLRENQALQGLKFEFQVRTVLQHAWAELAHDRNYKFTGKLPKQIERKLFLLAGLMETADNGFSELSKEIDSYVDSISTSAARGRLDIEVNSLSLDEFVRSWCEKHGVPLEYVRNRDGYSDLIKELKQYGVRTLKDLQGTIPAGMPKNLASIQVQF
jgi:ppGpp synthetase/RelA/SpoT-type nucleotidyltranferase